jgi:hypothetical protein
VNNGIEMHEFFSYHTAIANELGHAAAVERIGVDDGDNRIANLDPFRPPNSEHQR